MQDVTYSVLGLDDEEQGEENTARILPQPGEYLLYLNEKVG
jgi:hypothetical protein